MSGRSGLHRPDITTEEVVRLYVDERLSTIEVGKRLGCSAHTIRTRLIEAGIERRTNSYYKTKERTIDAHGYVLVRAPEGHPKARHYGNILEHRLVMEQHLGRYLRDDENVHHKNADRKDNRIENLELWTTFQPVGARVVDQLAWAHEIIARYEKEFGT